MYLDAGLNLAGIEGSSPWRRRPTTCATTSGAWVADLVDGPDPGYGADVSTEVPHRPLPIDQSDVRYAHGPDSVVHDRGARRDRHRDRVGPRAPPTRKPRAASGSTCPLSTTPRSRRPWWSSRTGRTPGSPGRVPGRHRARQPHPPRRPARDHRGLRESRHRRGRRTSRQEEQAAKRRVRRVRRPLRQLPPRGDHPGGRRGTGRSPTTATVGASAASAAEETAAPTAAWFVPTPSDGSSAACPGSPQMPGGQPLPDAIVRSCPANRCASSCRPATATSAEQAGGQLARRQPARRRLRWRRPTTTSGSSSATAATTRTTVACCCPTPCAGCSGPTETRMGARSDEVRLT